MNIQLHATSTQAASTASQSQQNLARDRGYPATCTPARPDTGPSRPRHRQDHRPGRRNLPDRVHPVRRPGRSRPRRPHRQTTQSHPAHRPRPAPDRPVHHLTLTIPARTTELAALTPGQLPDLITNDNPPG